MGRKFYLNLDLKTQLKVSTKFKIVAQKMHQTTYSDNNETWQLEALFACFLTQQLHLVGIHLMNNKNKALVKTAQQCHQGWHDFSYFFFTTYGEQKTKQENSVTQMDVYKTSFQSTL